MFIRISKNKNFKKDQIGSEKLYECPEGCGRKFNEIALPKHAKVNFFFFLVLLFIIKLIRFVKKYSNKSAKNLIQPNRE